jgi:hypothetical protein
MNDLTKKQMRNLFSTIELNMLLWLMVCGAVWSSSIDKNIQYFATVGMVVSAMLQHWAYYNLYKRSKEEKFRDSYPRNLLNKAERGLARREGRPVPSRVRPGCWRI